MRLHKAMELMQSGDFGGLKHWPPGDATKLREEVLQYAPDAAEFSLVSETDAGESLNTFQQFGFELWSAGFAKPPYSSFWLSWSELAQGRGHPPTSLAAMCVHLPAGKEGETDGIGIYAMAFVPAPDRALAQIGSFSAVGSFLCGWGMRA